MQVIRHSVPGLILVAASIVAIGFSAWAEGGSGSADSSSVAGLSRMVQIGLAMDPVDDGVIVTLAPPHQPAGQAGVREGDVIRRMDGEPVRSQADVVRKLRADRPAEVSFELVRDGKELSITVFPQPVPWRESDDFDIHYGAVEVADGELRRTITTQPRGEGPFPTIVMLGGIGCYSLDRSDDFPYIRLLDGLTGAGYLTYWVEKSGMGDSQGAPCMEIDFEVELSGYRAGLEQVRTMPEVDPDRIVLLGHSMGGIVGPVLAAEAASSEQPVHAVVAIGTTGLPWFEYLIANSRRQLHLSGLSPAEVEAVMRETVVVHYRYTIEKHSPEEILADYPDRSGSFALPHHYSYFQQVADLSPVAEWAAAAAPALLIAGGADYVTSPEEHRYVADILNGIRPGTAKYILIEDMNHGLVQARDAAAARAGETGDFHDQLVPAIVDWINGVDGRPSPAN
jgi:uncharacterized protein